MPRSYTCLAVVLFAAVAYSRPAVAQRTYTPQSPTISPWMGLWQRNPGALDNYHTYVQPQMELDRTLQLQNEALARQSAGLRALNYDIMQPQGYLSMMPTGQGATFMNYSHYYGGNRPPQPLVARPVGTGFGSHSGSGIVPVGINGRSAAGFSPTTVSGR